MAYEQTPELRFQVLRDQEVEAALDDLARLRISVFRDWPYLYDGDAAYEREYLQSYAQAGTILVAAYAGGAMVGASTGMPLSHHADDFAAAFEGLKYDFKNIFYCAESIVIPSARGQGAYRVFFAEREAFARAQGFTYSTFCGVVRPDDHPQRPPNARSLDSIWRACGYHPLAGAVARFSWRDVGAAQATEKPMQFWIKTL